jgi:hypothetical protein
MHEAFVVISGLLVGVVQWFPCGIGLAAHRYKLGGAVIRSTNKWVLLGARPPGSYSILGKLGFFALMLVWLFVFFGSIVVPALIAKLLEVPEASPFVGYAIYANFLMAIVAFAVGPAIWRRIAL